MYYNYLSEPNISRSMQSSFAGLNKNARINDGEFSDMTNMSSDNLPLLVPRKARSVVQKQISETVTETVTDADGNETQVDITEYKRLNGILGDVGFAAVWGNDFYYMGKKIDGITLIDGEKKLVAMGANVLIFPDGIYYNTVAETGGTLDENDKSINASSMSDGFRIKSFTFDFDGEEMTWATDSPVTLPCDFTYKNGHYDSLETGSYTVSYFWKNNTPSKFTMDTAYGASLFMGFNGKDLCYAYKGKAGAVAGTLYVTIDEWRPLNVKSVTLAINSDAENVDALRNGATNIWSGDTHVRYTYEASTSTFGVSRITVEIEKSLGDYFSRFATAGTVSGDNSIQVRFIWQVRTFPILDFVCVHENRLWGCHYGFSLNGDKNVNEIYCSKLGDFKTWTISSETATLAGDPYTMSVGDYGPFTGCISHRGYVLFFKDDVIYRVSGNKPSNFQITKISTCGVQNGCEKSMEIIDEVLYYKSKSGVYAYDGSLPQKISDSLGGEYYTDAVAGSLLSKYYITMVQNGERKLYVYDTRYGVWHAEDDIDVRFFTEYNGALYGGVDNNIVCLAGESAEIFTEAEIESDFDWSAESGDIGLSSPYQKYYHRLLIRMDMEIGARVKVELACDGGDWLIVSDFTAPYKRSFLMPIVTPRCDHMRYRISGKGNSKIYSISYETETVGDRQM